MLLIFSMHILCSQLIRGLALLWVRNFILGVGHIKVEQPGPSSALCAAHLFLFQNGNSIAMTTEALKA